MGKILTVGFLGEEYQIPEDIITYFSLKNEFDNYNQKLLAFLLERYRSPEDCSLSQEDARQKFSEIATSLVQKLYSMNIYTVTESDFLDNNPGSTALNEACRQVLLELTSALLDEMNEFTDGVDHANRAASSQITGSGTGIVTNSVISYAVWSTMEEMTINKQREKARRIYNSIIAEAESRGKSKRQKRIAEYIINHWLPDLEESANQFTFYCFDKFLKTLIASGKFIEEALNYIDIPRAAQILQHIDSAQDKQSLLRQAFFTCPVYLPVYTTAMAYGYSHDEMDSAINAFSLQQPLIKSCMKEIQEQRNVKRNEETTLRYLKNHIQFLSVYQGRTRAEIENSILNTKRQINIEAIRGVEQEFEPAMRIANFLKMLFPGGFEEIIECKKSNTLESRFTLFLRINILGGELSTFYDEEIKQLTNVFLHHLNQFVAMFQRNRDEYFNAISDHERIKNEEDANIAALDQEIERTSSFAFFKKRRLYEEKAASETRVMLAFKKRQEKSSKYYEFANILEI